MIRLSGPTLIRMKKAKLIDVIRLSEQENELLQNELDNENSKSSELSNRILKAIEYIEHDLKSFLYSVEYKTLLEILKGSDK